MRVVVSADQAALHDQALSIREARTLAGGIYRAALVVVPSSEHDRRLWLQEISKMPADTQRIWRRVLTHLAVAAPPAVEGSAVSPGCTHSPMLDCALVADEMDYRCMCGAQVLCWRDFLTSKEYVKYEITRSSQIRKGSNRSQVFADRFKVLGMTARCVTIIDRYLGKNILSHRGYDGLRWFLENTGRKYDIVVRILTCKNPAGSDLTNEVVRAIERLSADIGHKGIQYWLGANADFSRNAHARYVGYEFRGMEHLISLDKGMAIFDKSVVDMDCPTQYEFGDGISRALRGLSISEDDFIPV